MLPDSEPVEFAAEAPSLQALATGGLFVLATLYTLYIARAVLLPLVLAVVTSLVLRPVVRALSRRGIPDGLGALVVLSLLAGAVGWGVWSLSGPAATWMQAAPQALRRVEARVRVVKAAVQDLGQATDSVEQLTQVGETPRVVAVQQGPKLGETLLSGTWDVAAAAGMVLVLAYFLLASGDLFLRKLVAVLPTLRDRKLAVATSREIQDSVSAYLFTVSLINAALGAAVAAAMFALGMPNPLLWGVLAALLNFVPLLGSLAGAALVGVAAVLTFDTLTAATAPLLAWAALHVLEGSFLTPLILSRRFTLNPVVVMLGLLFWGWIWGVPGVLLAMPILVTVKILCDRVPGLAVVGEFLGS